jgi:hypothetical protein
LAEEPVAMAGMAMARLVEMAVTSASQIFRTSRIFFCTTTAKEETANQTATTRENKKKEQPNATQRNATGGYNTASHSIA